MGNYAQIVKGQEFQRKFQGKIVRRNSEKEVSMRRLDIVCVSRRAVERSGVDKGIWLVLATVTLLIL
jgi:hypothetical protein